MPEATLYSAAAEPKGRYSLPEEFDGTVNEAVLYHTVKAIRNNQRHGTASTKTRGEVSGGNRKPWRQKGTGRARQGSIRSPIWRGGGITFGPKPRDYHTTVPRKVRQAARRSAFNARASEGAVCVIEAFEFEKPKTKQMVELLAKLELSGKKVLILTADRHLEVLRSAHNIPRVNVMRYADASALDVLWADSLLIEEAALAAKSLSSGTGKTAARRAKRAEAATEPESVAKRANQPRKKKTAPKKADGEAKESDDA